METKGVVPEADLIAFQKDIEKTISEGIYYYRVTL